MTRRTVFTIVRIPSEGKYNNGADRFVYRDQTCVAGPFKSEKASQERSRLAQAYASQANATAEYATVETFDNVPEHIDGDQIVSRDCYVVER